MKLLNLKYVVAIFCILLSITKTNAQWSELGGTNTSTFNYRINSLATNASGNIYATGSFTNDSGNNYVAKWNGSSWVKLGGINGYTFNSPTTDASGNVYVAVGFTNVSTKQYVAKWNGSSWQELGGANSSTFNGNIFSLSTDARGNVYATGGFTNASGNNYVAKWNGSSWQELGGTNSSTFNNTINSLIADAKGNVFAGGHFTNSNYKHYVAKWDGSSWQELGGNNSSTFNSTIYSLTTDTSGNIFAAGSFTNNSNYNYVAKWNGSNWQVLGKSNSFVSYNLSTYIASLATEASGNVYAAGYFANSSRNIYVAKWDGSNWSEVGSVNRSIFNSTINSLITDTSGNLYAAGYFTNTNGKYFVAKYSAIGLPIKLASITATQEGKTITTNWNTSTELNTSHFIIQHSTDGSSYTDIGTVTAIGSGANSYAYTDNNPTPYPLNGVLYYRLQSVDKEGTCTYSKVVSVQLTVDRLPLTIAPNPSKDKVTVMGNHISSVQVIDNLGRVIKTQTLKDATNPTLSVNALPVGVYHLRVQTTDGKVSGVGFVKE